MKLLDQLRNNKGTVSSALGKDLAARALGGEEDILGEAVRLTLYEPDNLKAKQVRAGAAKIVEKVAEEKPEMVAGYLDDLIPALDMPEPQTKWMLISVFGYCARDNPDSAKKAVEHATRYIASKQGVCLTGAAARYLGNIGALSSRDAQAVLPVLAGALDEALPNEVDWILEGFLKIFDNLDPDGQRIVIRLAAGYQDAPKKATRGRVKKILSKFSGN